MSKTMGDAYKKIVLDEECSVLLDVIHNYITFLRLICSKIVNEDINREINKRKYEFVKKELYDFIINHKRFFKLSKCNLVLKDGSIKESFDINYNESIESFMKLDDQVKLLSVLKEFIDRNSVGYCYRYDYLEEKEEVIKTIESILKREVVYIYDVLIFFKENFLVTKDKLETKCKNYGELRNYVKKRAYDFHVSNVSKDRLDKLSFRFEGSIKNHEDKKSCGICFNDYEKDQEVTQLPCNHFYCRECIEKWFKKPVDGSKAKFQCPYCRDDCT